MAYGGARGGGKSWAVRKKASLLAVRYPGIRMLLLRRSMPELRENHILPLMTELHGIATYRETDKAFGFANGSRLRFGYCDSERDVLQYQGQEFDVIFMDEATQFSYFQFSTLKACLRGANHFPKRMYLTCNPGGVGHEWVKRLFVRREYLPGENPADYTFIPARVYDNRALLDCDPGYVSMLENLPGDLKRAWLEGDWEIFAGQYFTEFREDVHVAEPFAIPAHWRRYVALDYGLDMLAGYWIALDERGRAWVYREAYESGLIVSQAARKIREMSGGERIDAYLAPPDLWNRRQDTGKSAAELFGEQGVFLQKAENDRVQGWYGLKEWLRPYRGEEGMTARLKIFSGCRNLIRCLPALQHDPHNPNDCAGEPHELTHGPDALRYFAGARPAPAAGPHAKRAELPPALRTEEKMEGEWLTW
ncbi:MAG: phage terminase large subunit [Oscillospiraceae bacterium]|nr:phage terminase large subunit [Oscillospiraceae bacterium]